MNQPSYELFIMPTCPFCLKVLSFMKSKGIELPLKDTTADPVARQRLLDVGRPRSPVSLSMVSPCMNRTISSTTSTTPFNR